MNNLDDLDRILRSVSEWDMLNPPRTDIIADAVWLKLCVDEALAVASLYTLWVMFINDMNKIHCLAGSTKQPTFGPNYQWY